MSSVASVDPKYDHAPIEPKYSIGKNKKKRYRRDMRYLDRDTVEKFKTVRFPRLR